MPRPGDRPPSPVSFEDDAFSARTIEHRTTPRSTASTWARRMFDGSSDDIRQVLEDHSSEAAGESLNQQMQLMCQKIVKQLSGIVLSDLSKVLREIRIELADQKQVLEECVLPEVMERQRRPKNVDALEVRKAPLRDPFCSDFPDLPPEPDDEIAKKFGSNGDSKTDNSSTALVSDDWNGPDVDNESQNGQAGRNGGIPQNTQPARAPDEKEEKLQEPLAHWNLGVTEEFPSQSKSHVDGEPENDSDNEARRAEISHNSHDRDHRATCSRKSVAFAAGETCGMKFGAPIADKSELDKPVYHVEDFYSEKGFAQRVARSDIFSSLTLVVISFNAIYIGIDADLNTGEVTDSSWVFTMFDQFFCVFFTSELLIRFLAFRIKSHCLWDMWFKFDAVLVALMVMETWVVGMILRSGPSLDMSFIKMFRLMRLARMARLMRAFPELVAMIKGVKVASRAVGSALLMLLLLVYIFAIIMHMLVGGENENERVEERFGTLLNVMWTLLVDGAFMDNIGIVSRDLLEIKAYFAFLTLLVFVLLSALTVINMLIGVLCEVVSAVAAAEQEEAAIKLVKETLLVMLKELDHDCSGAISKEELTNVFNYTSALEVLQSLEVDVKHLVDHLDMFYEYNTKTFGTGDIPIAKIMEVILMLRGDRPTTMKTMLHGQSFANWKLSKALEGNEERIIGGISELSSEVNRVSIQVRRSVTGDPQRGRPDLMRS